MKKAKMGRNSIGDRIRNWWADKGCVQHSDMLRDRINKSHQSAIAHAVRKERERCIQCVKAYGLADTSFGAAAIARMEHRSKP